MDLGCVWSGACTSSILIAAWPVIVKHMRQNVFSVLKTLRHLLVVRIQSLTERHYRAFALFVHIGDEAVVRIEQDLCVILEVYLHYLVAQSEHDRMSSPHPLLDIDGASRRFAHLRVVIAGPMGVVHLHLCVLVGGTLLGRARLQIALEVLEQSNFLLEFFRELVELILGQHILFLTRRDSLSLIIVETLSLFFRHNLG